MMEFCEMIGAKPWFNINMMTGSPSGRCESGWSYCNRKEPTALSQERKQTGHEKPFEIEYWGIGNGSMGRRWKNAPPQMYANEYRKFSSSCPSFGGGDQAFSMKCIASARMEISRKNVLRGRKTFSGDGENTVCRRFTATISIFTTGI